MPPRQVVLTETEWQHVYELIEEDSKGCQYMSSEFGQVIKGLNDGILAKFDEAPDILVLECSTSPSGKHSNTHGIGTFGVYQCRFCHKEME